MQSQKKFKIGSLLSSLPSINKKSLLKPLELSEVIVVMVREQSCIDKTAQLRGLLNRNRAKTIQMQDEEAEVKKARENTPQFANKEWGNVQLLRYLIQKKRDNAKEEITLWERSLVEIEREFGSGLERYGREISEGKEALEEVGRKVGELVVVVQRQKEYIKRARSIIQQYNNRILRNTVIKQNITKTIAIARAWSKSHISTILSNELLNNISSHPITDILHKIHQCLSQLKTQSLSLQNTSKLSRLIQQRKSRIIQKVQKNMVEGILCYSSRERYDRVYGQYGELLGVLAGGRGEKVREYHVYGEGNLANLVQENVDGVVRGVLEGVGGEVVVGDDNNRQSMHSTTTTISKPQHLSQSQFLHFLTSLCTQFSTYLLNYHNVTKYHITFSTPYKQPLMSYFKQVPKKMSRKITYSLKSCSRFGYFSTTTKVKIILQLNRMVELWEEWTGVRDNEVFGVMAEKIKVDGEGFRKETNGEIRVGLVGEFTEEGLLGKCSQGDRENVRSGIGMGLGLSAGQRQQVQQIIASKLYTRNKGRAKEPSTVKQSRQPLAQPQLPSALSQLSTLEQQTSLQFTFLLTTTINQYIQRSILYPYDSILQTIIQHIQFTIMLLFRLCVTEQSRQKFIEDYDYGKVYGGRIREIEVMIEKGYNDEIVYNSVRKVREAFVRARASLELKEVMGNLGGRFDGVVVGSSGSVDKLYGVTNRQHNEQMLVKYTRKVLKLVQELTQLLKWVIKWAKVLDNTPHYIQNSNVNTNSHNNQPHSPLTKHLQLLPSALTQLCLLHLQKPLSLLSSSYLTQIQPLITKSIKWKIQTFTSQTTLHLKQYKLLMLQIFRSSVSLLVMVKSRQLYQDVLNKCLQVFYKALLQMYVKIQKINDNGRQLLRIQLIQIAKILKQVGYDPGSWAIWIDKFIETIMQRNPKHMLDKIQQLGIVYPISCWRSQLLWLLHNMSTKQKKQYLIHLLRIYVEQLRQLPQL